jgi:hypothetical protein
VSSSSCVQLSFYVSYCVFVFFMCHCVFCIFMCHIVFCIVCFVFLCVILCVLYFLCVILCVLYFLLLNMMSALFRFVELYHQRGRAGQVGHILSTFMLYFYVFMHVLYLLYLNPHDDSSTCIDPIAFIILSRVKRRVVHLEW